MGSGALRGRFPRWAPVERDPTTLTLAAGRFRETIRRLTPDFSPARCDLGLRDDPDGRACALENLRDIHLPPHFNLAWP